MLTINFIKHFAYDNASIAYLLTIVGMVIEGEVVVIIAGIFAHLGSLHLAYIFLAILIGGAMKSFIGYSIGYYLQKNHSDKKILRQAENRIKYFLPSFIKRPFISIFLSRFLVLGMHWFALIFAGYKKINLRTYIKSEATSLVAWSLIMLSIGYFFSFTALSISRDFRKFLIIILICFIVFFIIEKVVAFIIEFFETQELEQ